MALPAFLIPALLGAAAGGLTNRKDPLKGALMGGALGGVGGAFAPGLLGAGGATAGVAPGATAASQAGMLAAQEAGLGASALGWGGATTGTQGALNGLLGSEAGATAGGLFGTADKFSKPVGAVMSAVGSQEQPEVPMAQPTPLNNPPLDFSGIFSQQNDRQAMEAEENKRRREMMAMFGRNIGGGY